MTMESAEFDSTLGGAEHLPFSANSLKFAASRSVEIVAMTESILRPSKTKLIFQSLPVHMRRRVMSHNCKRLPKRLRNGHLEQLKKSGLPPKQKRPSRKYRRRPANLLDEYNRRQKRNMWLETHIWHAKRFHMIERWGYRLAYAPCDKAFRACYRASSAHCLLQDISYYVPIQITGSIEMIRDMFTHLTNSSCGLSICAKAFTNGVREGSIHFYKANKFPYGYIGKVQFVWVPSENLEKTLLIFVHPSQINHVESTLTDLIFDSKSNNSEVPEKRRKLQNKYSENIHFKILRGKFNRYRLTGPNSHCVLTSSLKCINNYEEIKMNTWVASLSEKYNLHLKQKSDYWQKISMVGSPAQLPPRIVVGLIIRDPRLSRPLYRTKARPDNNDNIDVQSLINIPEYVSESPLLNTNIHETIKNKILTNAQFIEHVTKTQLVPGAVNELDPALQSVPVILIQRPGSQNPQFKKLGYGSGWDILLPSGYGLPFWQTFIMFGGRAGALRETKSLAFEMGECYLPPDSDAGKEEEKSTEFELREKYFKLPPSKRVNYIKLAITSPFACPWEILLKDWSGTTVDEFHVLRDRNNLKILQECILSKKELPQLQNTTHCLIAVYVEIIGKGSLKQHALICLPQPGDFSDMKTLFEPHHHDSNEKLRKQKRAEHFQNIKRWRKRRKKMKKIVSVTTDTPNKKIKNQPSEYVKTMRELWLPSNVTSVRYSASREILGYISQGAFSFSEAKSCGVGYVAYNALSTLLKNGYNQVLIRNTSSRKYRLANIHIIENT